MGHAFVLAQQSPYLAQALGGSLEDAVAGSELRLLRHMGEPQALLAPDHAVIGRGGPGDDPQQAALTGAVAADQRDLVAAVEREVDMIQQPDVAIGQRHGFESQQRHGSTDRISQRHATFPSRAETTNETHDLLGG